MEVTIPIRLVSEANAHSHWRVRQKRAKEQRGIVALALHRPLVEATRTCELTPVLLRDPSAIVTLTRIATRALDSDNLVGAFKHVRDGVADALGINDRDPRVTWEYRQERGRPGEYAVRIVVESNQ